jgi:hypothetical protein
VFLVCASARLIWRRPSRIRIYTEAAVIFQASHQVGFHFLKRRVTNARLLARQSVACVVCDSGHTQGRLTFEAYGLGNGYSKEGI